MKGWKISNSMRFMLPTLLWKYSHCHIWAKVRPGLLFGCRWHEGVLMNLAIMAYKTNKIVFPWTANMFNVCVWQRNVKRCCTVYCVRLRISAVSFRAVLKENAFRLSLTGSRTLTSGRDPREETWRRSTKRWRIWIRLQKMRYDARELYWLCSVDEIFI